jgi:2-oxoglutarate dehydrogenase E1 component
MNRMNGFTEINQSYLAGLYERYLRDPASVDPQTRAYFDGFRAQPTVPEMPAPTAEPSIDAQKLIAAANYVTAIRTYGHLAARVDPLGQPPHGDPSLQIETHGITPSDLQALPPSVVDGPIGQQSANALVAIERLRAIYCSTTGYEYGHIRVAEERKWLRETAESGHYRPPSKPVDPQGLLDRLSQVEAFEQFLHRHFPGKTRFSIEGVDMLVPMLDEIVGCSADAGICMIMIGMAHRGRLNVLAHILQKSYAEILAEFQDPRWNFSGMDQMGWTGDVKYHKGALRAMKSGKEVRLVISMAPNPSHLEHINPVIEGMARSAGSKTDQRGAPPFYPMAALPILIHGDASFPGEGVTSETLNLSRLPGYDTGGTIHIITNNQLGYTTTPKEGRSTLYASDLAKGFEIPIVHVNADDPIAVLEAARTAFAYRDRYKKDFLIDLIGYRRYGHNEGDEPSFTQPRLYEKINHHPTVRNVWADQLVSDGASDPAEADKLLQKWMGSLKSALDTLKPEKVLPKPAIPSLDSDDFKPVPTGVPLDSLEAMNAALVEFPEGFHLNHKLERPIQRRRGTFAQPGEKTIDWATAEELAFAAILSDGIPIRLTGQDVERGTFSQRHAVFHDVENGKRFIPLQKIPQVKAAFDIHNSPLSENAALGFEFGYSVFYPRRMAIWEAQYGDFINSAQAIVDEFIVSAQAKWEQRPSLTLLLPHGYEGQGPDHSSGRPERFLSLASQSGLRIANCTTAAQYFHLLRLQASTLLEHPAPLVVFTPKSLLRHPFVASSPDDLASGEWRPALDDPTIKNPKSVRRLLFCTGKIAVDLLTSPERGEHMDTAILRVEQLFPFPLETLRRLIDCYPKAVGAAWVQEEPENMGAGEFARPRLANLLGERLPLQYVGRPVSSSPAEGSTTWHTMNQVELISQAFHLSAEAEKSVQKVG